MSVPQHSYVIAERPSVMLGRWLRTIRVGLPLLAMTACVSASNSGQAADYSLAYGIELNGKRDMGVLNECNIAQPCKIRDTRADVVIMVMVDRVDSWLANLRIYASRGEGCCVFGGGSEDKVVDVRQKLISVPIFVGRRLRRNEWIRNISVGTLWLSFSNIPNPKRTSGGRRQNSTRGPI